MALKTVHVSGPARGGKTTLIQQVARQLRDEVLLHLRLVSDERSLAMHRPLAEVRSSRRHVYAPERVYEQIPAFLHECQEFADPATVLLETDANPCFRLAYSYDVRIFVMPAPQHLDEVFRNPEIAERFLRQALQDSAEFAHEMFGMERVPGLDDSRVGLSRGPGDGAARSAADLHDLSQVLATPLGAEIAARVKLEPTHHALLDADVVVLNAGRGGRGEIADVCARRIERLIASLPPEAERRPRFFSCDPLDPKDPLTPHCLDTIARLLRTSGTRSP